MQSFEEQMATFLQGAWELHHGKQKHGVLAISPGNWRMRAAGETLTYFGTWSLYQIRSDQAAHYGGAGYALSMIATKHDAGGVGDAINAISALSALAGPVGILCGLVQQTGFRLTERTIKQEIHDGKHNLHFVLHSWTDTSVVLADTKDLQPTWSLRRV